MSPSHSRPDGGCWEHCQSNCAAVSQFRITTQDDLPGPDGDEPYVLFVNQTEYGNARFLRTNVLSARPDLKKYTALRFRQDVKRHPELTEEGL